ncbi:MULTISPECIES: AbrB/MazE/SpoVT family DNA-binding domain-containing protein [unclassified Pseudomonas]|uniref:AbrB/MazE/SpoVT family DNA-binding domain-containing protein n=1 Tax=unclassified Pseudomonas TaxID=196821 RepID=UPI000DA7F90B|nr:MULTISPECIES: AbrB/MazE/SpoVT family DNA-binding domain-containing protein [unclassified Pseudomonas]MDW3716389.1 AbrB/MazE/SpoVT family DNA-binding domain-containing protein [Pseudomonas sp. 2023EL-01195]PZE11632.1 AbrB family transcriptional regulator [Pseudomonas sp. 57B-090624]
MPTATLSAKGRITLPLQVRESLGLTEGDRVEFIEIEAGKFAVMAAGTSIRSLKGAVSMPTTPVSIEDMNEAIERGGSSAR